MGAWIHQSTNHTVAILNQHGGKNNQKHSPFGDPLQPGPFSLATCIGLAKLSRIPIIVTTQDRQMSSFRIGQPTWVNHHRIGATKKKVIWRPVGDHCCGLKVVGCLFWVWDSEYGIQASLILSMLKQGKSFVVEAGQWQFFAGHALVCNRNNLT